MRDTDMYGVEGSNQSKNNGDGRYVDAVDMVELLDEGVEVTGDVVEFNLIRETLSEIAKMEINKERN